jgi:omega-6 fatty acid desaturase (delta-12 desaturase)
VDALSAKEQSSKKGDRSANFAQSIDEEDITFLKMILRKHGPNDFRAMVCLAWTFVHGAVSLYLLHNFPSWWSVLISGAFVVRGFIVFHDACHNSFFTNPSWNRKLAWIFSTFIPQNASDWTKSHNHHHRHLGRFDIMDFSLTVWFSEKEYRSMPLLLQIAYRIIRDPFILPNLLSAHVFWLFPFIKGPVETAINRLSFYAPLYALLGQKTTLLYLTSTWVGGIIGIQLFHLQHQCNTPYRVTPPIHSKWDAGMLGSTYLLMPWPLSFMTLGIEYHHIHHASTQVPCYNLAACHDEGTRWSHSKDVAGKSGSKPNLWERAGVNVVGPKRAFLSLFHTLFEGDVKYEEEGKPLPRFTSFDIYKYLGLVDTEC